jgi:hypothetical protein
MLAVLLVSSMAQDATNDTVKVKVVFEGEGMQAVGSSNGSNRLNLQITSCLHCAAAPNKAGMHHTQTLP